MQRERVTFVMEMFTFHYNCKRWGHRTIPRDTSKFASVHDCLELTLRLVKLMISLAPFCFCYIMAFDELINSF